MASREALRHKGVLLGQGSHGFLIVVRSQSSYILLSPATLLLFLSRSVFCAHDRGCIGKVDPGSQVRHEVTNITVSLSTAKETSRVPTVLREGEMALGQSSV